MSIGALLHPGKHRERIITASAAFLGYAAAAILCRLWYSDYTASPLFLPQAGLAFALVYRYGIPACAPIAAASCLVNCIFYSSRYPLPAAIGAAAAQAVITTSGALLGTTTMKVIAKKANAPTAAGAVLSFFIAAVLCASAEPAGSIIAGSVTGAMPLPFLSRLLHGSAAFLSITVTVPALYWFSTGSLFLKQKKTIETAIAAFLLASGAAAAFIPPLQIEPLVVIICTLPVPCAIARRYGPKGLAACSFIYAAVALFGLSQRIVPLHMQSPEGNIAALQLHILFFFFTGFFSLPVFPGMLPGKDSLRTQSISPPGPGAPLISYESLLNRLTEGIALCEVTYGTSGRAEDFNVHRANKAFQKIFEGNSTGTALFSQSPPPCLDLIERVLGTGSPEEFEYFFPVMKKHLLLMFSRLSAAYFTVTVIDVSERIMAQDSFLKNEERLRLAMEAARMGIWELVIADDTMLLSDNVEEILGLKTPLFRGHYTAFLEHIHPEDRETVRKTVSAALNDPADVLFYLEYRLHEEGTSYRWIQSKGRVRRGPDGNPEKIIGTLTDLTWKKKAEEYLRISEMKFQQVFQESPIAISLHMMDGKFIEANKAFTALTGYSHDDIKGLTFKDISHPEDLEREVPLYHSCLRGEIQHYALEKRYLTKNGDHITVNMTAAIIEDESSLPLYVLNMAVDVSEQKQQEEQIRNSLLEKSILLKEIHHRVKNNMQIISSILNLQTGGITDETVLGLFSDCQNRVHSMALVHEKLYQSGDMTKINFDDYIKDLVNHLYNTYTLRREAVTTIIDITDIFLGIDTAIPTALIINELTSNAMKYAFRDMDSGTITIRMFRESTGEHTMIVSDNGVGLPDGFSIASVNTLGLQLVQALTGQIKGKLAISRDNGTTFSITF